MEFRAGRRQYVIVAGGIRSWWERVVVAVGLLGLAASMAAIGVALRFRDLTIAANIAQLVSVVLIVPGLAAGLIAWRRASRRARDDHAAGVTDPSAVTAPVGWLIDELTDPFALDVHPPVDAPAGAADLPLLPPYVERPHDEALAHVVQEAAAGASRIAVLVGGSSTGKTRACWEVIKQLPGGWRLWYPIGSSRPETAIEELPRVGPRTVVWLNDANLYLSTASNPMAGERVAAGLRDLLRDPDRRPVLVLGTIWPQDAARLTGGGSASGHSEARGLLTGNQIHVPDSFTDADLSKLRDLAEADPRLAQAADDAKDKHITQYLAGVPVLLERYRTAWPAARALIHAAMDARRLGCGRALPRALLEAAAPGYLTDHDWEETDGDWLEQAFAFTTAPCKGVRGILTPVRPRPAQRPEEGSNSDISGHHGDVAHYQLSDYLEQIGPNERLRALPPKEFWDAVTAYAADGDTPALAVQAQARGLYRYAARLRRRAAEAGDTSAAAELVRGLHAQQLDAQAPAARWAARETSLDDPAHLASLLEVLGTVESGDQAEVLLERDPAAHTALHSVYGVRSLLEALQAAGRSDQVAVLARRAAAGVPLDDPYGVAILLEELQAAGRADEVAVLARRAAVDVPLDDPGDVVKLLHALRKTGRGDQFETLLRRDPVGQVTVDEPYGVASLLEELQAAGRADEVAVLARRAAVGVHLDTPYGVARLLKALQQVGRADQVDVLAARTATDVPLDDPGQVATLLEALRGVGAHRHIAVLLHRDPVGHVVLQDAFYGVASLLDAFQEIGHGDLATALVMRAASHSSFDDLGQVAGLLEASLEAGHGDLVAALAMRAAADGRFENGGDVARMLDVLHKMGRLDLVGILLARDPVGRVALEDAGDVADLVEALHRSGRRDLIEILLARDLVNSVDLDAGYGVVGLLKAFQQAGCVDQVVALARRVAVEASLDYRYGIASLLEALQAAGRADEVTVLAERAAEGVPLGDPNVVAEMLEAFRKAGRVDQIEALLRRDPVRHVALHDLRGVGTMMDTLRKTGHADQALELVTRVGEHVATEIQSGAAQPSEGPQVPLTDTRISGSDNGRSDGVDQPSALARQIRSLRENEAHKQIEELLAPGLAERVDLADRIGLAELLRELKSAKAAELAADVAVHAANAGLFDVFVEFLPAGRRRFRFGREPDGSPSAPWGWDDL
jgi:hypothetical protein